MLIHRVLTSSQRHLKVAFQRNIGVWAPACQKAAAATDPIQKLFLEKIQEYRKKSESSGGKLVDPTPQIEKDMKAEMDRVAKIYGGGPGVDMTKFPTFSFPEPTVDPINMN